MKDDLSAGIEEYRRRVRSALDEHPLGLGGVELDGETGTISRCYGAWIWQDEPGETTVVWVLQDEEWEQLI